MGTFFWVLKSLKSFGPKSHYILHWCGTALKILQREMKEPHSITIETWGASMRLLNPTKGKEKKIKEKEIVFEIWFEIMRHRPHAQWAVFCQIWLLSFFNLSEYTMICTYLFRPRASPPTRSRNAVGPRSLRRRPPATAPATDYALRPRNMLDSGATSGGDKNTKPVHPHIKANSFSPDLSCKSSQAFARSFDSVRTALPLETNLG